MPHWIIYHPSDTFSDEPTKQALAQDITDAYAKTGPMPAFYVVVTFIPVPDNSMFIGGQIARSRGKPFIRISVAHIHVNIGLHVETDDAKRTPIYEMLMDRYDKALKPHIYDKGYDWEIHIDETERRLWTLNGMSPPPFRSEDEKIWKHENRPISPEQMRSLRKELSHL